MKYLSGHVKNVLLLLKCHICITFPFKLVHDKKIQAMKVQPDRSFRCKCEMLARRERVSGILPKRESLPGANEVGGHDRGKH